MNAVLPRLARFVRAAHRRLSDEAGFTLVAASSVMTILMLVGAATIALTNVDLQQVPRNRAGLRAQLAAESALDAAQYRMAKTAGGLLGKSGGGSLISIGALDQDAANLLCIKLDTQTNTPALDVGNQHAGMCPEGAWEKLGDGTEMLIRQQQLGVLAPRQVVSRVVVGVGRASDGSRPVTRRVIMRIELKLDDTGNLSLIRRRGVALCTGAYDSASPMTGCPTPSAPPTASTAGNNDEPTVPTPTVPEPVGDGTPKLQLVPHVDGVPEEGETLTVQPGQWSQLTGDAQRIYTWYRCSSSSSACTTVKTGTTSDPAASYGPLTPADHGDGSTTFAVRETVTNNPGASTAKTASALSVATLSGQNHTLVCRGLDVLGACIGVQSRSWSVSTRPPRITGTFKVGQSLTVDDGSWVTRSSDATTSGTFALIDLTALGGGLTRTWYRCNAIGSSVADASTVGAVSGCTQVGTGRSRTVVAADVGKRLIGRSTVNACAVTLLNLLCIIPANNHALTQATPIVVP